MPGLVPTHFAAVAAVTFAASFTQGVAGFGAALLAMPLLALFLDVKTASPLVALLSLAINIALLLPARRRLPWRRVAPLLAGSLAGVPAGVLFLAGTDERFVRAVLGAVIVASSIAMMRSRLPRVPPGWETAFAAGGVGGVLGGAFNTSGPPVMLYAASQPWEKSETHAVLQLYFLASNVGIVSLHALSGLTTPAVLFTAVSALPALAAGSAAGWVVHRHVREERFRALVRAMLLAAGLALLLSEGLAVFRTDSRADRASSVSTGHAAEASGVRPRKFPPAADMVSVSRSGEEPVL